MAAVGFLKDRIIVLMKERDKAIAKADELQDNLQEAKEMVTTVSVTIMVNIPNRESDKMSQTPKIINKTGSIS